MNYLYAMKAEHQRNHSWQFQWTMLCSSCRRSLERGLGPAAHAVALHIEKACDAAYGPAIAQASTASAGVDVLVAASARACREIELASAFRSSVVIHEPSTSVGR